MVSSLRSASPFDLARRSRTRAADFSARSRLGLNVDAIAGTIGPKMAAKKTPQEPAAKLSFEGTMARLTEIVKELESGELGLAESLARFEEGVKLSRSCQEELDRAEARVEELLRVEGDGTPVLEELEDE